MVEGGTAHDHLEEHAAKRIEVAALVRLVAAGALGRHVVGGAQDEAGLGHGELARVREHAGGAEVADLHVVAGIHEHVGGLEVVVDDSADVGGLQSPRDAPCHHERAAQRQRSRLEELIEGVGLHELHHEKGAARGARAEIGDVHDSRVVGQAGRASLAAELGAEARVLGHFRVQYLHRYRASALQVEGAPNHTHPAPAQLRDQAVGPARTRKLGAGVNLEAGVEGGEGGHRAHPGLEPFRTRLRLHQELHLRRGRGHAQPAEPAARAEGVELGEQGEANGQGLAEAAGKADLYPGRAQDAKRVAVVPGGYGHRGHLETHRGGQHEVGQVDHGHAAEAGVGHEGEAPTSLRPGPRWPRRSGSCPRCPRDRGSAPSRRAGWHAPRRAPAAPRRPPRCGRASWPRTG